MPSVRVQYRRRHTPKFLAVVVVGVSLIVSGCAGNSGSGSSTAAAAGSQADGRAAGAIAIASADTPFGIDPHFHTGPQTWDILTQAYSPVVTWKEAPVEGETGVFEEDFRTVEPGLASEWEFPEDAQSLTLTLKPGIVSSAGNELTAQDVQWTFDRALETKALGLFFLSTMDIQKKSQVEVLDKYTVRLTPTRPSPVLLNEFTSAYLSPLDSTEVKKHATAKDPWATKWLTNHTAGFGPYSVTEWSPGDRVVMEANPNWKADLPYERILYLSVPEAANRLALLNAGDVQIAQSLTPEQLTQLDGSSSAKTIATTGNYWTFLRPNLNMPPLDKPELREALNYAVPQDQIVDEVFRGFGAPLKSVFSSVFPGYTEEYFHYTHDLDKARQLVEQAGATGAELTISYSAGVAGMDTIAQILKTNWDQIGLKVQTQSVPPSAFETKLFKREFQMPLSRDLAVVPDAVFAETLFLSSGPGGVTNYGNYKNAQVDELLAKGTTAVGQERDQIGDEVQRIAVAEDPAYVFIAQPGFQVGAASNIGHFTVNTIASYYVDRLREQGSE